MHGAAENSLWHPPPSQFVNLRAGLVTRRWHQASLIVSNRRYRSALSMFTSLAVFFGATSKNCAPNTNALSSSNLPDVGSPRSRTYSCRRSLFHRQTPEYASVAIVFQSWVCSVCLHQDVLSHAVLSRYHYELRCCYCWNHQSWSFCEQGSHEWHRDSSVECPNAQTTAVAATDWLAVSTTWAGILRLRSRSSAETPERRHRSQTHSTVELGQCKLCGSTSWVDRTQSCLVAAVCGLYAEGKSTADPFSFALSIAANN